MSKFVGEFIGSPAMNFLRGTVAGGHVVSPHMDITLRDELRRALLAYEGQEVWAGFRPENLSLGGAAAVENVIRARVKLVEPVGAETIIIATAGGEGVTARVEAEATASAGEDVTLVARPDKVHVFDVQTERNILFAAPAVAA